MSDASVLGKRNRGSDDRAALSAYLMQQAKHRVQQSEIIKSAMGNSQSVALYS